ncbi:hypothetical protein OSB04_016608 [Centaurea solstitialis]|uniref:Endonuclease/exonuclease/phosphatase domain-containing protein n=1 Tax=Centaurea solstitialis TaxID=347529 RepID=A0AA38TLA7_9ASTR|nr:hypothetical protein OSB04_016608 [Centaurea solstitialis]
MEEKSEADVRLQNSNPHVNLAKDKSVHIISNSMEGNVSAKTKTSKILPNQKRGQEAEASKSKFGDAGSLGRSKISLRLINQMVRNNTLKKFEIKTKARKERAGGIWVELGNSLGIEKQGEGQRSARKKPNRSLMKITSLNLRGLGMPGKKLWVKELCHKEKPNLIGLQETKMGNWSKEQLGNIWGWDNCDFAHVPAEGSSGFVVAERNFVAVIGEWNRVNGLVGFINVYGPREQKDRLITWQMVESLCVRQDVKWCLFGDFNEVRREYERLNTITNPRGVEEFNNFIRDCDLIEVSLGNRRFTRVSDDGRKFSKLHRFLTTRDFADVWKGLGAVALERRWSDHHPIMVSDCSINFGPKPIKIFDSWLEGNEAEETIREAWLKDGGFAKPDRALIGKLKNVRLVLHEKNHGGAVACQVDIDRYKAEVCKFEEEAERRDLNEVERSK